APTELPTFDSPTTPTLGNAWRLPESFILALLRTKFHFGLLHVLNVFFAPASTLQRFNALTIQPFNVREAKTRSHFPPVFLAIRSMSAIGIICHWSLAPPAATRFPSPIITAVIVLPHRRQFRRGPLMRNTCSE